jgi:hypothetical protein
MADEGEITVEMVVVERVRELVENSLPYLDGDKFNARDDHRWAFICFVVGCVMGAKEALTPPQVHAVAIRVIVEIFNWPSKVVLGYVTDAMAEAHQGINKELYEAGMNAIAEFEHAIFWLKAVCDALVPEDESSPGGEEGQG